MAVEKNCFDEAKHRFESEEREHCNCFPSCVSLKYSIEKKIKGIKRFGRVKETFRCLQWVFE